MSNRKLCAKCGGPHKIFWTVCEDRTERSFKALRLCRKLAGLRVASKRCYALAFQKASSTYSALGNTHQQNLINLVDQITAEFGGTMIFRTWKYETESRMSNQVFIDGVLIGTFEDQEANRVTGKTFSDKASISIKDLLSKGGYLDNWQSGLFLWRMKRALEDEQLFWEDFLCRQEDADIEEWWSLWTTQSCPPPYKVVPIERPIKDLNKLKKSG